MLLALLEGIPTEVARKGGFVSPRLKKVIFTCPYPPCNFNYKGKDFKGAFAFNDKFKEGAITDNENVM